MTILMCITWLILFVLTIVAFWRGLIFRSKDEDVLKDFKGVPFPVTKEEPEEEKTVGGDSELDYDSPTLGYVNNTYEGYNRDPQSRRNDNRV